METTIVYWGYNGIMENKMETTIVYWGYTTPIMENQIEKKMENEMETGIIAQFIGNISVVLGEGGCWGLGLWDFVLEGSGIPFKEL